MARYTGPVCRLCRREGTKLYLKGERCYTDKCAVDKRKTAPGQHGAQRRSKMSDFGIQLREKQKLRRIYGVLERSLRRFLEAARHAQGKVGEVLVRNLEMRLDSVAYRAGWALSRSAGRQLVRHNHVLVNGKRCNIPSRVLRVGDRLSLVESSRQITTVLAAQEVAKRDGHGVPTWLKVEGFEAVVLTEAPREDIHIPVREQLVVELYSK